MVRLVFRLAMLVGNFTASSTDGQMPSDKTVGGGDDSFNTFFSSDGMTWTALGSATATMPASVNVGFAVTSHSDGILASSVFDNVTITQP